MYSTKRRAKEKKKKKKLKQLVDHMNMQSLGTNVWHMINRMNKLIQLN